MDFNRFNDKFRLIEEKIKETLTGDPENLYDAGIYLARAGGKRIRPLLCMLSCESVGGTMEEALDSAVAIELIHIFSLIHDDIMDNDDLRRGVPSVHKVFGEPTAILAGDLLFSKAFEIGDPRAIKVIARASGMICEGQEKDISFETKEMIHEEEYMDMIKKKTAVLIEAATRVGGIIGCDDETLIENLSDYGLSIGLAFQIYDDILDLTADEKKLGKPVGSDIESGKKSLIVIHALETLSEEKKEVLKNILQKESNTPEEIKEAIILLKESGSIEYAKNKALELIGSAKKNLDKLPESESKNTLIEIADFFIKREK